ncbi:uncharacterized protein LOC135367437 isoform X2 [Ornithodoros turicata]|uniref:uncharacterized protein LOC135367437 isoform X2 n=1 Tax=Ornithodoros turicata TaxID=34597 RepID=UPI0031395B23
MHEESIFSELCAVEAVSSGSCMRQPQHENLVHSGRSAMGDRDQPRDFCHASQTVTAAIAAEPPGAFDNRLTNAKPLSKLDDGRFHVRNGFVLTEEQAYKIFRNKRPTLVMKDMAKAISGDTVLAVRTYSGKTAPKDRRDPEAPIRKELTPMKVGLVIDAVIHWGRENKVDVSTCIEKRGIILSEKIQDARKSARRHLSV